MSTNHQTQNYKPILFLPFSLLVCMLETSIPIAPSGATYPLTQRAKHLKAGFQPMACSYSMIQNNRIASTMEDGTEKSTRTWPLAASVPHLSGWS